VILSPARSPARAAGPSRDIIESSGSDDDSHTGESSSRCCDQPHWLHLIEKPNHPVGDGGIGGTGAIAGTPAITATGGVGANGAAM
jgi:hypothetical protein